MKKLTALVVEDNYDHFKKFAGLLAGLGLAVERAGDAAEALEKAKTNQYDVVILDNKLPSHDGHYVLKEVRKVKPRLPVIAVSEYCGPAEEAGFINEGADDFISKGFHDDTFRARVMCAIRHGRSCDEGKTIHYGDIAADESMRTVSYCGRRVDLTDKEFSIFLPLLKARGRRVDPDILETAAWGDVKRTSKRLEMKIKYMRDKFERQGAARDLIDSNRGIGYVLNV